MIRKWWHDKVAYQIYPKSYMDSNGDGIGDIKGIIGKLDYIKDLGIDIVWISPMYQSPLADQGYDISDYYAIDPVFGTMEDMEELLAQAKIRDISIVMDLVVNHCSDEHEWFKKACEDPDGKYGKYFYIEDWHEGEKLPNNLRSHFGGSVWDKLPGHDDKVYFHAFHKKQPDLNWENPEVREEIYKMINWWLEKGIAGFRIDAINNIKKVLPFKDYPQDREDGMCSTIKMIEDANGIELMLDDMAENTFRRYNAITIGEVFNEKPGSLPKYIGDRGCFESMFDFNETVLAKSRAGWHAARVITPDMYKNAVFESQKKVQGIGFYSNIIENHDQPRGCSHYIPEGECCDKSKKMLGGLNFMLSGLPFIYQGQEIGMENFCCESIDEVDDVQARDEYKVALAAGKSESQAMAAVNHFSRDNGRSPFHWDDSEYAGFSTAKPWLKVNPNYKKINLKDQEGREDSVYNFYKKLIALRKEPEYKEVIVYGNTVPYMPEAENLMAYFRCGSQLGEETSDKVLLVMGNYQMEERKVELPAPLKKVLLNNCDTLCTYKDDEKEFIVMEGYQFLVLELEQ